jgi:hypothetical protein
MSIEGTIEMWVVIITIGLVFLTPFVGVLESLFNSSELAKVGGFLLQTIGISTVIYFN